MLKHLRAFALYASAFGLLLFQPHLVIAQEMTTASLHDGTSSVQRVLSGVAAPRLPRAASGAQRQVQACLPNNYCWKPGLPRCCSGTCTATPKCPGVQSCLCE